MPPLTPGLPAPVLFLRDLFGGDFDTVDGTVAVNAAGKLVCGGDPEAVALTIINLGSDIVWVRPKVAGGAASGIQLNAGGGALTLIVRDDGPLPTYDWFATPNSGSQNVYFLRLSRYTTAVKAT